MRVFRMLLTSALLFMFSFTQAQADEENDSNKLKMRIGLAMWFDGYDCTFVNNALDCAGPSYETYWEITGKAKIPATRDSHNFFIFEITGDLETETGFCSPRSNGDVYMYDRFGAEMPYFRNLEVGSSWEYQERGETYKAVILAIQDITVPAGFFPDCVLVWRYRITGPSPGPGMLEWFSIGFMMVQDLKLGDSPMILNQLRSFEWLDYKGDDDDNDQDW